MIVLINTNEHKWVGVEYMLSITELGGDNKIDLVVRPE